MHEYHLRVYYEDTDMAGIVYYANYLRYIERARSEYVRDLGVDQVRLKSEGLVFAVRRVEADYIAPAKYDDQLTVRTAVQKITAARMVLTQDVCRGDMVLFASVVTIVALNADGGATRLPAELRLPLS